MSNSRLLFHFMTKVLTFENLPQRVIDARKNFRMAENSSWSCLKYKKDFQLLHTRLMLFRHVNTRQKTVSCTYLCYNNITLIESWYYSTFIEGLGVELVTWTSFNWICKVTYDHIIKLFSPFKLSPGRKECGITQKQQIKPRKTQALQSKPSA